MHISSLTWRGWGSHDIGWCLPKADRQESLHNNDYLAGGMAIYMFLLQLYFEREWVLLPCDANDNFLSFPSLVFHFLFSSLPGFVPSAFASRLIDIIARDIPSFHRGEMYEDVGEWIPLEWLWPTVGDACALVVNYFPRLTKKRTIRIRSSFQDWFRL